MGMAEPDQMDIRSIMCGYVIRIAKQPITVGNAARVNSTVRFRRIKTISNNENVFTGNLFTQIINKTNITHPKDVVSKITEIT